MMRARDMSRVVVFAGLAAGGMVAVGEVRAEVVTRTATVKAGSAHAFTSWIVETDNSRATVTAPPGWTAARAAPGSRTWHITGGTTNPGATFTAMISNDGGVGDTVGITRGDYNDARGVNHLVSSCGDPIGQDVVFGGATGTTYLGYHIPANHYGYFHQQWQPADAEATLLSTRITIGRDSQAYNFQVIQNSFRTTPGPGFDLGDIAVPFRAQPENVAYEITAYMDPDDATGNPGIPTAWTYNSSTGVATIDFSAAGGLMPGMTGSIVAYTSPLSPDVPGSDNLAYSFQEVGVFGCPEYDLRINTVMVPGVPVPTPASAAMLGLSGLLLARRRR